MKYILKYWNAYQISFIDPISVDVQIQNIWKIIIQLLLEVKRFDTFKYFSNMYFV